MSFPAISHVELNTDSLTKELGVRELGRSVCLKVPQAVLAPVFEKAVVLQGTFASRVLSQHSALAHGLEIINTSRWCSNGEV